MSYRTTYYVGAAVDARGHQGRIVRHIAPAGNLPRVQLSTDAGADRLMGAGIVTDVPADPTNLGQAVTVCAFGACDVIAGAGWAAATRPHFVSDANGRAVPAADNAPSLGVMLFTGRARPAEGEHALCIVNHSNQGA